MENPVFQARLCTISIGTELHHQGGYFVLSGNGSV
jgi:hypothetical protein